MLKKTTGLLLIIILLSACSGKPKEKQYIQVYKDMYKQLIEYVKLLREIEKKGKVTPGLERDILNTQKTIISIRKSVDKFGEDYDTDPKIRKKLRKTLINISIANYYIKRMQERIKKIHGVKELFIKLRNRGKGK
mgnify:CR=1 FL=1